MANEKIKVPTFKNLETFADQVALKYAAKTEVPTKVSDLTNDSKFQTEEQVAAAVAAADHLQRRKVDSVAAIDPAAEGADKYIYMVPKTGSDADDLYDEYMVLDGKVEHVGNTKVDLSGYAQSEQVAADIEAAKTAAVTAAGTATDEKLTGYLKTSDIEEITEEEIIALFNK